MKVKAIKCLIAVDPKSRRDDDRSLTLFSRSYDWSFRLSRFLLYLTFQIRNLKELSQLLGASYQARKRRRTWKKRKLKLIDKLMTIQILRETRVITTGKLGSPRLFKAIIKKVAKSQKRRTAWTYKQKTSEVAPTVRERGRVRHASSFSPDWQGLRFAKPRAGLTLIK